MSRVAGDYQSTTALPHITHLRRHKVAVDVLQHACDVEARAVVVPLHLGQAARQLHRQSRVNVQLCLARR